MKKNPMDAAQEMLTRKYGKEKWFVKVETYGDNRLALFYRETKSTPNWGFGQGCKIHTFASVRIDWIQVP